jgi:hypothetical protein
MTDKLASASLDRLDERMNQLACEIATTSSVDPRRLELVNEMSRLSLFSATLERNGRLNCAARGRIQSGQRDTFRPWALFK